MTRSFRACLLLPAVWIGIGCAGFNDAYDSRVCWSEGTWLPGQCDRAFVEFGCPAVTSETRKRVGSTRPFSVRVIDSIEPPVVGELFSQNCPPACIAILVDGESPSDVLATDVLTILRDSGHDQARSGSDGDLSLEIEVEQIDVRSDAPGWLDLKIRTRARASFSARLRSTGGHVRWAETFSGSGEVDHAYAALSDYQSVLTQSYCQALDGFANAVTGEDFASALDGN